MQVPILATCETKTENHHSVQSCHSLLLMYELTQQCHPHYLSSVTNTFHPDYLIPTMYPCFHYRAKASDHVYILDQACVIHFQQQVL